jgi:hypothetical protein
MVSQLRVGVGECVQERLVDVAAVDPAVVVALVLGIGWDALPVGRSTSRSGITRA